MGYEGNLTNSYVGFADYFDRDRAWYHTVVNADGTVVSEWFRAEQVTIAVNVPDKVVGTRDYVAHKTTVDPDSGAVGDSVTTESVMNIVSDGGTWEDRGVYFIDPYDISTWYLAKGVTVYFDDGTDENGEPEYDPRHYDVTWVFEGESYADGIAFDSVVREANGSARYLRVTAVIGSGDQTMEIELLVQLRSAYMYAVRFTANGNELNTEYFAPTAPYRDGVMVENSVWTDDDHSVFQIPQYLYYVDTYYRFVVPDGVKITFSDASVRSYPVAWKEHAPWAPGDPTTGDNTVVALTDIGNGIACELRLDVKVEAKRIYEMNVAPTDATIAGTGITFTVNYTDKTITVNVPDGRIYIIRDPSAGAENVGVIGVYDQSGTLIKTYAPYDFFMALFDNIVLTFTDMSRPDIVVTGARRQCGRLYGNARGRIQELR